MAAGAQMGDERRQTVVEPRVVVRDVTGQRPGGRPAVDQLLRPSGMQRGVADRDLEAAEDGRSPDGCNQERGPDREDESRRPLKRGPGRPMRPTSQRTTRPATIRATTTRPLPDLEGAPREAIWTSIIARARKTTAGKARAHRVDRLAAPGGNQARRPYPSHMSPSATATAASPASTGPEGGPLSGLREAASIAAKPGERRIRGSCGPATTRRGGSRGTR